MYTSGSTGKPKGLESVNKSGSVQSPEGSSQVATMPSPPNVCYCSLVKLVKEKPHVTWIYEVNYQRKLTLRTSCLRQCVIHVKVKKIRQAKLLHC